MDKFKAIELFKQADRQNLEEVQYYLAQLYKKGIDVEKNYKKYIKYLRKSAENGDKDALNEIRTEIFINDSPGSPEIYTHKQI